MWLINLIAFLVGGALSNAQNNVIKVGAKQFTESYLIGELMSLQLEQSGFRVRRVFGLGNSLLAIEALIEGEVDIIPEYQGTLVEVLGKNQAKQDLASLIAAKNLLLLPSFGFENSYALAVRREFANRYGLSTYSDLKKFSEPLRGAFSFEFMQRAKDGLHPLTDYYGLQFEKRGMEHALLYNALIQKAVDIIEVYTTDGKIEQLDLVVLKDDKNFFPDYSSHPLVRAQVSPQIEIALRPIWGKISVEKMRLANSLVDVEGYTVKAVAQELLNSIKEGRAMDQSQLVKGSRVQAGTVLFYLGQHVYLTFFALILALVVAIPMGLIVFQFEQIQNTVVFGAGLLQTIPALALLFFMVPVLGIGMLPAIAALFLYSILPILQNTIVALRSIDSRYQELGFGMGLTRWQVLKHIEIPLALPVIVAGVRIAAVTCVGTATIAAFIGAGGLGSMIVQGLTQNNMVLITLGAGLSAALAAVIDFGFMFIQSKLKV